MPRPSFRRGREPRSPMQAASGRVRTSSSEMILTVGSIGDEWTIPARTDAGNGGVSSALANDSTCRHPPARLGKVSRDVTLVGAGSGEPAGCPGQSDCGGKHGPLPAQFEGVRSKPPVEALTAVRRIDNQPLHSPSDPVGKAGPHSVPHQTDPRRNREQRRRTSGLKLIAAEPGPCRRVMVGARDNGDLPTRAGSEHQQSGNHLSSHESACHAWSNAAVVSTAS